MKTIDTHICREIWTRDDVIRNHRELCLRFRGRFSGSAQAADAALFIESQLKKYSLADVHCDWFEMSTWRRGTAELEICAPITTRLPAIALPYAPSCERVFELLDLGMGHPKEISAAGEQIRDRAVLIDDRNPRPGPYLHRLQKYVAVLRAGAGAFLFAHTVPGMLPQTGSLAFNHNGTLDQAIPAVALPWETSCELRQWLRNAPVRIRLNLENTLQPGRDCNVLGTLPSNQGSDEIVLVCAHYDAHDIGQGALDNASGTAVVMEIARVLAPLQPHLKRRLQFALFGSEEMGLVGSYAHSRRYQTELGRLRFIFNLDCVGTTGPLTLMLQNAPGLMPHFSQILAELPAQLDLVDELIPFSDHFPFWLHGVPAVFCTTRNNGGRGWGHTAADTYDKVPGHVLQSVAMHMARLIIRVVQSDHWPQVRVAIDERRTALHNLRMEPLMRYEGHWPWG